MKEELLVLLKKIFWIIGWVTLGSIFFALMMQFYIYLNPPELHGRSFFDFFKWSVQIKNLFSSLGLAYFAFLISSVFSILLNKSLPEDLQQNRLFLRFAVMGLFGEGLMRITIWIEQVGFNFSHYKMSTVSDIVYFVSLFLDFLPNLMPILYGITIYTLFTYFIKMIEFESEVI